MYENLKYEVKDSIAYVTVSRPKALNALNTDVLRELVEVVDEINKDDSVRVAIVTGDGEKSFVAGADISQMCKLGAVEGRAMMAAGHKAMNAIDNSPKPFIAAVNGFALGGGNELAMACDIRIASENAKFGQPEVGLGIIPGFGGTQRLTRLVGKGMAKYLVLANPMIDAAEAKNIGLVEFVTAPDELMAKAEEIAKMIIKQAPIAVSQAKIAINNGADMDLKSASAFEIEATAACFGSEDQTEGMTAFLEKRKAEWKNK